MCHITESEKEDSVFILEELNSAAVIWMIQQIDGFFSFNWVYSPECLCHSEMIWVFITAW